MSLHFSDAAAVNAAAIEVSDLYHPLDGGRGLALADWRVAAGGRHLVLGPSGSGKSTLLHMLAGLRRPERGRIAIAGTRIDTMAEATRDRFRGRSIGMVFQTLHLIGALSVLDNLRIAGRFAGAGTGSGDEERLDLLERLGIAGKARARPETLSQGEAQRLAIARAVVNRPAVMLADEPTSALDDGNAEAVIGLLIEQAGRCGAALVVATHDRRIMGAFEDRLSLDPAGAAP